MTISSCNREAVPWLANMITCERDTSFCRCQTKTNKPDLRIGLVPERLARFDLIDPHQITRMQRCRPSSFTRMRSPGVHRHNQYWPGEPSDHSLLMRLHPQQPNKCLVSLELRQSKATTITYTLAMHWLVRHHLSASITLSRLRHQQFHRIVAKRRIALDRSRMHKPARLQPYLSIRQFLLHIRFSGEMNGHQGLAQRQAN